MAAHGSAPARAARRSAKRHRSATHDHPARGVRTTKGTVVTLCLTCDVMTGRGARRPLQLQGGLDGRATAGDGRCPPFAASTPRESEPRVARFPVDGQRLEDERGALDAYSAIVTSVAAQLTPRVAALRIRAARGESAGSAVVLTGEGHLVTNSHVVGEADGGTAEFADGTVARFDVVGRDPLSDLAVVRDRPCGAEPTGVRRGRLAPRRLPRRGGRQPAGPGRT